MHFGLLLEEILATPLVRVTEKCATKNNATKKMSDETLQDENLRAKKCLTKIDPDTTSVRQNYIDIYGLEYVNKAV